MYMVQNIYFLNPILQIFVNAVTEISSDMNHFDNTKYPFAVFDQKGYTFDTMNSKIPKLYLKPILLEEHFICGL